jgi:hypothetical protein
MNEKETLLTVLDPRGQPSGVFGRTVTHDLQMMDILDPFEQPEVGVEAIRMAPRLSTLDGKTVYLVDTGFAGSQEFMEEVRDWFSGNLPSVKTVLHKKKTSMFTDDPELWVEIKANGDAVVFGVGG